MFVLLEPYFRSGEVVSRDCVHGEGEVKVPSFLAE